MESEEPMLKGYSEWKLHELGLGRGVDGTNPQPWINKIPFQIREAIVRGDGAAETSNLIYTDEGGTNYKYAEEIESVKTQLAKFDISVTAPNTPVSVAVGADMSRSLTVTKKAVGERVLNKTIAFKPVITNSESEEYFLKYALDFARRQKDEGKTYAETLASLDETSIRLIFQGFVGHYGITHYISSISLGACSFTVQSEKEYYKKFSGKGGAGYGSVGKASASAFHESTQKNKSKSTKCVGKFAEDGTVEKEAVINVKFESVLNLVLTEELKAPLEEALRVYVKQQHERQGGPYLISCNDARIFWSVREDESGHASIYATENVNEASEFYIHLTDDGGHPYEFYIGWKPTSKRHGTIRYLHARVNFRGAHNGPLSLENLGRKRHCLFSINNCLLKNFYRLRDEKHLNVNPEHWFEGGEAFLIRCRRIGRIDGFVAVEKISASSTSASTPDMYKTVIRANEKESDCHLTFQLHPKRKFVCTRSQISKSFDISVRKPKYEQSRSMDFSTAAAIGCTDTDEPN